MQSYHIFQLHGCWTVRCDAAPGLMIFNTRRKAAARCRELAGSDEAVVFFHRADGTVTEMMRLPRRSPKQS